MFINCIFPIFRSCTEECCKLEFLECSMTSSDSGLKLGGNETSGGDRGGDCLSQWAPSIYAASWLLMSIKPLRASSGGRQEGAWPPGRLVRGGEARRSAARTCFAWLESEWVSECCAARLNVGIALPVWQGGGERRNSRHRQTHRQTERSRSTHRSYDRDAELWTRLLDGINKSARQWGQQWQVRHHLYLLHF